MMFLLFFFFKQKTAYEMRISDWSSDVCSSDLRNRATDRRDRGHPSNLLHQSGDLQYRCDRCVGAVVTPREPKMGSVSGRFRAAGALCPLTEWGSGLPA